MLKNNSINVIAFYLPQFHCIPENDRWWGKGFTEWTNVKKAQPLFDGHYQPHLPHEDFGYYDLSDKKVLNKQALVAKQYGIDGFCFYHYWFAGKKLLDTPLNNMLQSGSPDFPFCVCWANENWTRTWDGQEKQILISQKYSEADDIAFIEDLIPAFKDKRYIKIDGKPVLVVYRTGLLPDIKKTANLWRAITKKNGLKGLYLIRVEGLEDAIDPKTIDFDAALEFAPDWRLSIAPMNDNQALRVRHAELEFGISKTLPIIRDYDLTINRMINRNVPNYKYFRGVFPSWDNTARRGKNATIFLGSSPNKFQYFVNNQIKNTQKNNLLGPDEKIIFINAWNEWGEGCHLEPDKANRYAFLDALKNAKDSNDYSKETNMYVDKYIKNYLDQLSYNYELNRSIRSMVGEINNLKENNIQLESSLKEVINSKAWKYITVYRKNYSKISKLFKRNR